MPSSFEDLTFVKKRVFSVGKGRKTVNLKTTMELDQSVERGDVICQCSRLTCVPEKTDPIPNITLPYLRHVEYADADTKSWRARFAYLLFRSLMRACSGGRPN
jgi:hypothetical protein